MKKYKGYEYLVLHMPMGHLCGYVKVPKNHPYYEKSYDDMNIDCHGGLTYATMHTGEPDIRITKKNNYEKYFSKGYWIGFDYAHLGDWEFYSRSDDFNEKYNTITQPFKVEEECKRVINQLIKVK